MRLIDADALIAKNCENIESDHGMRVAQLLTNLVNAPTITPDSLRPKGRWEQIGYDDVLDRITCSHCKEYWNILDNDTEAFNFCPNCGADMTGDDEHG